MAKRIIGGSLAAAVLMFVWGFLYWAVIAMMISPWHAIPKDGDHQVIAKLKEAFPEKGVYMYPWGDTSNGDQAGAAEEFEKAREAGPFVQIVFDPAGVPASDMGKIMGMGFLHMFGSALLCSLLLAVAEPLCCYRLRVCFVTGLGLFASVWIGGSNLVWWHHPISHTVFMGGYTMGAWLLAGLVIGAIVRKPKDLVAIES